MHNVQVNMSRRTLKNLKYLIKKQQGTQKKLIRMQNVGYFGK